MTLHQQPFVTDGASSVAEMTTVQSKKMWEPVTQPGHISDRIERQIVELLAAEQLRPGDRLPSERELATLLGVSRPSLREAVKSLEAHGRLNVRHGQGVFVALPQSQTNLRAALHEQEVTLAELFAMREVLEVPATGWAASATDEQALTAAREALEELAVAESASPIDFKDLQRLDSAFHMHVVMAAGNRFLRQTLSVLQDMMEAGMETTLVIPGRLARSRIEHAAILAALTEGNERKARAAASRHIRNARNAALRRIEDERRRTEEESGQP